MPVPVAFGGFAEKDSLKYASAIFTYRESSSAARTLERGTLSANVLRTVRARRRRTIIAARSEAQVKRPCRAPQLLNDLVRSARITDDCIHAQEVPMLRTRTLAALVLAIATVAAPALAAD